MNDIIANAFVGELYLQGNAITSVQELSFLTRGLVLLNLDRNRVKSLEKNAFFNLKIVQILSIAQN